jgi:LAGLIDADG endonuclease
VFHRFVVTQGVKSVDCLEALRDFFGVGRIFINERHDNHKEHLCQYLVGRRTDLMETVIPFFRQYPLRTAKRADFDKFAQCVELTANGSHLTSEGLIRIAEIAQTMNWQKPRHELIRILRGHTPDALDGGR